MEKTTQLKTIVKEGDSVTVTVKNCLDPKMGDYGESMLGFVTYKGEEYSVYFKEKDFDKAKKGATLLGVVKSYKDSPYFEWYSTNAEPEAKASNAGMEAVMDIAEKAFETNAVVRDHRPEEERREKEGRKEINLPGRGASWNNAFAYCLKYNKHDGDGKVPSIEDLCIEVAERAEQIARYQEAFVNMV